MTDVSLRLQAYQIEEAPRSGLQVFLKGDARYVDVLRRAFPDVDMFGPYPVFRGGYDHLVYVHDVELGELDEFLGLCNNALLLSTTLDECWALDHHMLASSQRSSTGQLVYAAKTYPDKPGDPEAARALGTLMSQHFSRHPRVCKVDRVLGVPANPPKTPHNLPDVLALAIAEACGLEHEGQLVVKISPTAKMKDGIPDDERLAALRAAYEVRESVKGESIAVVDDLLRSGTTMGVIAQSLRRAGAREVIGLVATRTLRS